MIFRELDVVSLVREMPLHGLKIGDTGAVVELYEEGFVEVEFINSEGSTIALLTMNEKDLCKR